MGSVIAEILCLRAMLLRTIACVPKIPKLGRGAAHAAETVELNKHCDSGSVALGGKPKLEFVHLAVTAPTPNSAVAVRGC
jgi:hypothetical protein